MTTPQSIVIEQVTKRFGHLTAVDNVSASIRQDSITGLLGRNGAGKTTLMNLLTGLDFVTEGSVKVFGENPVENAKVLQNMCFVKESQRYPDHFTGLHVLQIAPLFYPNWDQQFADQLVEEYRLPVKSRVKKMSRGQQSALGVILGLASRAPITIFDEPYLGLDVIGRQTFYNRLLEDYEEHPRTIILSTHLIDEVSNILEHVLVINEGEIIIDSPAEDLRGSATTLTGKKADVEAFIADYEVLSRHGLGGLLSATIHQTLTKEEKQRAIQNNLELTPVSLQELVIQATQTVELHTN